MGPIDYKLPMKIVCPLIESGEEPAWGPQSRHMLKGFKELGVPVEEMSRMSYGNLVYFDLLFGREEMQRIWVDCTEYREDFYSANFVSKDDVYFKTNLRGKPIPQLLPLGLRPTNPEFLDLLPGLRERHQVPEKGEYTYDMIALFGATELTNRLAVVKLIRQQPWKTLTGMVSRRTTMVPDEYKCETWFSYESYLYLLSQSLLGLAMPGANESPGGCRRTEMMGIGMCGLIPKDDLVSPGDLHSCLVEFEPDLSDFVEKAEYYLHNPEERKVMGRKALEYYERYLSPKGMAAYILETVNELRRTHG